jgi:SAM-dependent methyltransferase
METGSTDDVPLALRLARKVLPKVVRHRLGTLRGELRTRRSPDRKYQNRVIVPRIAARGGTALLVGCRRFTAHEPAILARQGAICWTLDIDPAVARWGAVGRHVIAPIEQASAYFSRGMFDTVLLSGVFGFGINDLPAQEAAIAACAAILKPGGLLVLGWNTDRVADPSGLRGLARDFRPSRDGQLAGRVAFRGSTHVFDFYCRRGPHD